MAIHRDHLFDTPTRTIERNYLWIEICLEIGALRLGLSSP